jgi:hypothetical protein
MTQREVRVFYEGTLRWVQASGTGAWQTASAAPTALVGFVQAGFSVNSGQNVVTIMDRGQPHHHKVTQVNPLDVSFTYLLAATANIVQPATAVGASTKQAHFELRIRADEDSATSYMYYQFINGVRKNINLAEAENGDTLKEDWVFLSMNGPTASGYIA